MAIPTIRSVGTTSGTVTGQGRNNLVIGETVTLSDTNGANTGFGHVWSFIDKPIGSTVTLSTPTSATSTFVPDVTGSYFIQCLVNGTDIGKQILAVPLPTLGVRIPAFTETIDYTGGSNTKGWHETETNFMRTADTNIGNLLAIPKNVIFFCGSLSGNSSTSSSCYVSNTPGSSSDVTLRYPVSARIFSKLRVTLLANSISVNVVIKLFKNGVATTQLITIASTDTALTKYVDLIHPITFSDGDDFDIQMSCGIDAANGTCDVSGGLE